MYRCVADEERHLSLGVISFIVRAVGSIPGPLITGAVFDSACLLRQELQEECGLTGNCLVYDNEALAVRSLLMLFFGMSISSVFAFFVWLFYPKKSQENDKDKSIPDGHEESNNVQTDSSANGKVCIITTIIVNKLIVYGIMSVLLCKIVVKSLSNE